MPGIALPNHHVVSFHRVTETSRRPIQLAPLVGRRLRRLLGQRFSDGQFAVCAGHVGGAYFAGFQLGGERGPVIRGLVPLLSN